MESAAATVRSRGITRSELGTLETDPSEVAIAINETLASGASARALALDVPAGHSVTADDVIATNRRFVRFVPSAKESEARP